MSRAGHPTARSRGGGALARAHVVGVLAALMLLVAQLANAQVTTAAYEGFDYLEGGALAGGSDGHWLEWRVGGGGREREREERVHSRAR